MSPPRHLKRAVVATLLALLGIGLAAPARAQLRTESEITYTADVEQGSLDLESRLVLTNLTPDVREEDRITSFYYDRIQITVPETVQNFRATSGGRVLSHSLRPGGSDGEHSVVATIDFGRRLLYQQTMEIRLEYEIPGDPPRSKTTFRINPAYINFAVVGWGDPGQVTVNVVTPARFDLELTGADWDQVTTSDGTTTHTFSSIEKLDDFVIHVKGYDDQALVSEAVDVMGAAIVVRAWPGDEEWATEVSDAVGSGLPALMDLIGLSWTPTDPLPVNESAEVTLAGYGGWYLQHQGLVELSEWADAQVVLHELSHVWFNQDLFLERWINEGLAEVYSWQATADSTSAEPSLLSVAPEDEAGVGSLNNWVVVAPSEQRDQESIRAYEEYGYAASRWVVQGVSYEIGFDAMARVLASAEESLIAYSGASPPERVEARDDWRRFLDLLEEIGGSRMASDLFGRYVTDDDLTAREETRHQYHQLVERGRGWLPPLYIRRPMSDWEFDAAAARIAEARAILQDRLEVEDNLTDLGLAPTDSLEEAYETATDTFDGAAALADQLVTATDTVVDARLALDADRDLITEVGLLGSDPDAGFRRAIDDLESEDFAAATEEARHLTALLDDADEAGRFRLAVTATGLVVVVAGMLVVLRLGRTRSAVRR